ncbi:MAG: DnaA N-terminal domain-containing protein, partial [Pseudomonadota bacterium]
MSRQSASSSPFGGSGIGGLRAEDAAAWERMRAGLRRELGKDVFDSWLSRLTLADATPTDVRLRAPTRFIAGWVEETYGDALRSHAARCFDPSRRVVVETRDPDERPAGAAPDAADRDRAVVAAARRCAHASA